MCIERHEYEAMRDEVRRLREQHRLLNENLDSVNQTNQAMSNRLLKLQAENERLRNQVVPEGWQDISTAPKPSGQVILAAINQFGRYEVANGHWYATYNKWVYDCHFPPKAQPTHWMPLPQPPTEKERG